MGVCRTFCILNGHVITRVPHIRFCFLSLNLDHHYIHLGCEYHYRPRISVLVFMVLVVHPLCSGTLDHHYIHLGFHPLCSG